MKKTVVALLIVFSICALVCSCSAADETFPEIISRYDNLAKDAKISSFDGGTVGIELKRKATFNRLVLKARTDDTFSFEISIPSSPSPFYGNDFIGGYRYCSFPAVTTDKLVLSVNAQNDPKIFEAEAYYVPADDRSFSVSAYVTAKYAYSFPSDSHADCNAFDVVYSAYIDKDARVRLPDYYLDGQRIDGEDVLSACVKNVRSACPAAKVFATVLGDREFDDDGLTMQQRLSSAFSKREKLAAELLSFVEKYALDGISFDYEYPLTPTDYSLFADFSAYLKTCLPPYVCLSAAVSAWCVDEKRLGAKRLAPFDRIILMSYDEPDKRGCHSTFYTAYSQLKHLKKEGVPFGKIILGIPLYAKPTDGSQYTPVYADYADSIPFFCNISYADCDGQLKPCFFNGRQLVADKTALALDAELAGVTFWHYGLDSSDPALSLISVARRISDPRKDR